MHYFGRDDTSKATMFFSNSNSCSDVPTEKVSWEMFFHHPLQNCLRPEKLVGTQNESPDNDDESDLESITSKSSKPVKVKHVTFHSWIYEIKQMCTPCTQNKTGIPKFWKDGMIEGFIDRNTLHEELQKKKGRFALYFSDALLGGLTVAWYNLEMKSKELVFIHYFVLLAIITLNYGIMPTISV